MSVTMIFRQNPGVTIAKISNFGKQLSSDNVENVKDKTLKQNRKVDYLFDISYLEVVQKIC